MLLTENGIEERRINGKKVGGISKYRMTAYATQISSLTYVYFVVKYLFCRIKLFNV